MSAAPPADRAAATRLVVERFDWYRPTRHPAGFLVHNEAVARTIAATTDPVATVESLLAMARGRGLFTPVLDRGMVVTSTAPEIVAMHENRWVTDSIHLLDLLPGPAAQARVIAILASFYASATEREAALRVIARPSRYTAAADAREGIAHLFRIEDADGVPRTCRDPDWHNNQRLESHGLALGTLSRWLARGADHLAPPDVAAACDAVATLGAFVVAIDYPSARSAGAWEETPLPGGLSWDTEAIRAGLVALRDLAADGPEPVREAIRRRGLEIAAETGNAAVRDAFAAPGGLDPWVGAGARVVRARIACGEEAPGMRGSDAALAFLGRSDLEWADSGDPREDRLATAAAYAALLDRLHRDLVRESGMIRYAPFALEPGRPRDLRDSYLAVNYWLNLDPAGAAAPDIEAERARFGSADASDPEVLAARNRLSVADREAEWFLVTELARGYARQARRLAEGGTPSGEAAALREHCLARGLEGVLRGFARITPERGGGVKSNGHPCPPWALPEAYEWVRRRTASGAREECVLPGANTTLAWAAVSLERAAVEWLQAAGKN
ncbi:MAG: hypothetical protein ACKO5R_06670 [Planctomycetaceae bacterium]